MVKIPAHRGRNYWKFPQPLTYINRELALCFRRSMNNQSHHSVLSDEDIDYWDKTEEDVMSPCMTRRRSKRLAKRPSAPPEELLDDTPPKRHKPIKTEVEYKIISNRSLIL